MADTAEDGALRMRDFISNMIDHYEDGCATNPDQEAGRIAAAVARSIGRLVKEIPARAALQADASPSPAATGGK